MNLKETAMEEIQVGIDLAKCQQCGCMRETLDQVNQSLASLPVEEVEVFLTRMPDWLAKMKPVQYSCLGCDHCFAGAAQNAFTNAFPQMAGSPGLNCEIQETAGLWPPVVGDYIVVDPEAPIAVVTLASLDLPSKIAGRHPEGLAITGKLETENIGVDKLIKNMIANQKLRCLVVAGVESIGHQSGQTLLALAENGIDPTGRVIGSRGKRPVLRNVTGEEVEAFRRQVQVVDLIGCEDVERITGLIKDLGQQARDNPIEVAPCGCAGEPCNHTKPMAVAVQTVFIEDENLSVKLDPAGYFVIYLIAERKVIHLEHYGYDNTLLHILEGSSPRAIYLKIIAESWATEMSHSAYLGKELVKAEISLRDGTPYFQDAA